MFKLAFFARALVYIYIYVCTEKAILCVCALLLHVTTVFKMILLRCKFNVCMPFSFCTTLEATHIIFVVQAWALGWLQTLYPSCISLELR
jgi:hypothetical protein